MSVVEVPGMDPIWLRWADNYSITNLSRRLNISESEVIQRALGYYEDNLDKIENTVAYLCDREQCKDCSSNDGWCFHTTDIRHAINFEEIEPGKFMERSNKCEK